MTAVDAVPRGLNQKLASMAASRDLLQTHLRTATTSLDFAVALANAAFFERLRYCPPFSYGDRHAHAHGRALARPLFDDNDPPVLRLPRSVSRHCRACHGDEYPAPSVKTGDVCLYCATAAQLCMFFQAMGYYLCDADDRFPPPDDPRVWRIAALHSTVFNGHEYVDVSEHVERALMPIYNAIPVPAPLPVDQKATTTTTTATAGEAGDSAAPVATGVSEVLARETAALLPAPEAILGISADNKAPEYIEILNDLESIYQLRLLPEALRNERMRAVVRNRTRFVELDHLQFPAYTQRRMESLKRHVDETLGPPAPTAIVKKAAVLKAKRVAETLS